MPIEIIVKLIEKDSIKILFKSEGHTVNALINWFSSEAWEPNIFDKDNQYIIQTEGGKYWLWQVFPNLKTMNPMNHLFWYGMYCFLARLYFFAKGSILEESK